MNEIIKEARKRVYKSAIDKTTLEIVCKALDHAEEAENKLELLLAGIYGDCYYCTHKSCTPCDCASKDGWEFDYDRFTDKEGEH